VFFTGEGRTFERDGFEVLGKGSIVTASPSVVKGFKYRVEKRLPISRIPADFLLLSEKRNSQLSRGKQHDHDQTDTIGRIKAAYDVLGLAQEMTKLRAKPGGRWWHGRCPFHEDKHASFWVDAERDLWGCFACKVRGDVINLYAKANNMSVQHAISDMAKRL
jgi:hypothetical protein